MTTQSQLAALDALEWAAKRAEENPCEYMADFGRMALDLLRANKLVLVPSVEEVADVVRRETGWMVPEGMTSEEANIVATAVLASMGAKTDGQ